MRIKVEIFCSPGCSACGRASEALRELAGEYTDCIEWRAVDVLEELDYAVRVGVQSAPSIAIDGKLVFTGLPSMRRLRAEFDRRLILS